MIFTSTKPPSLWRCRYRNLFLLLQAINAVRFYTCPDELNFKGPPTTYVTLVIVLIANAAAFIHGLDGGRKNWEMVQHCMVIVGAVYMVNIMICLYHAYRAHERNEDTWNFVWDQVLHWHETFVTSAMWTIARAEARYYETVELLEKTNAEYNSQRPKRTRRRQKNED
ncbi:unnamed protein product [Caenorhabditis sp. 36 PRJEB53466]|nr:unnamed protein product [Caenorhabditis sp. 36 PRJEB53466]